MKTLAIVLAASSLALGSIFETRPAAVTRLRIDSFEGRSSFLVDVFARPAGLALNTAPGDSALSRLRVRTPAVVLVADSVEWLRVTVVGSGAVRFTFDADTTFFPRHTALWGRDVELRRLKGRFVPITRIIPLYP